MVINNLPPHLMMKTLFNLLPEHLVLLRATCLRWNRFILQYRKRLQQDIVQLEIWPPPKGDKAAGAMDIDGEYDRISLIAVSKILDNCQVVELIVRKLKGQGTKAILPRKRCMIEYQELRRTLETASLICKVQNFIIVSMKPVKECLLLCIGEELSNINFCDASLWPSIAFLNCDFSETPLNAWITFLKRLQHHPAMSLLLRSSLPNENFGIGAFLAAGLLDKQRYYVDILRYSALNDLTPMLFNAVCHAEKGFFIRFTNHPKRLQITDQLLVELLHRWQDTGYTKSLILQLEYESMEDMQAIISQHFGNLISWKGRAGVYVEESMRCNDRLKRAFVLYFYRMANWLQQVELTVHYFVATENFLASEECQKEIMQRSDSAAELNALLLEHVFDNPNVGK